MRDRDVAKGLRGVNQRLEDQFDEAAAAAERSFNRAINLLAAGCPRPTQHHCQRFAVGLNERGIPTARGGTWNAMGVLARQ
jgi:hypothetical protein